MAELYATKQFKNELDGGADTKHAELGGSSKLLAELEGRKSNTSELATGPHFSSNCQEVPDTHAQWMHELSTSTPIIAEMSGTSQSSLSTPYFNNR